MRRSKQAKQETHERIIEAATRRFRTDGIAGVAIADLMGEAGLTHGGFYAHFGSKDALVAEACATGLTQTRRRLLRAIEKAPPEERLARFIDLYLSAAHRDHPETGCALPTLSGEVARANPAVRAAYTQAYRDYRDALIPLLPKPEDQSNQNDSRQSDEALMLLAGLAGTMLLARAVDDHALSERILRTGREFYKRAFHAVPGEAEQLQA